MLLSFTNDELDELLSAIHDSDISKKLLEKIRIKKVQIDKDRRKLLEKKELKKDFLILSANKLRERFINNPTDSELCFQRLLDSLGVSYIFQNIFYLNTKEYYIADFYLPDYDTIFEIGCFKDKHGNIRVMDSVRLAKLHGLGIKKVYRIDNKEVLHDISILSEKLKILLTL